MSWQSDLRQSDDVVILLHANFYGSEGEEHLAMGRALGKCIILCRMDDAPIPQGFTDYTGEKILLDHPSMDEIGQLLIERAERLGQGDSIVIVDRGYA